MRVLILGGSGSIGEPIVELLVRQGYHVFALSRSSATAVNFHKAGATSIPGDIRSPEKWIHYLKDVDAVIHAASTWSDDMDDVDQRVVTALLAGLKTPDSSKSLIYTGGCWIYGNTSGSAATENTPFCPTASFTPTVSTMKSVLEATNVRGMVIHPAMVYEHRGGVFGRMYDDIAKLGHVRVFGSLQVHWPLIHRDDLAHVYSLMLQRGKSGNVYNAAAIEGVAIGDIACAISTCMGCMDDPVVYGVSRAMKEFGDWAEGYALDQRMSGQKARTELSWRPAHLDVFDDIY